MENKTSKRIKLLIGAVLLIFLAMAALDTVSSSSREAFKRGYETGRSDSRGMIFTGERHMWTTIEAIEPDAGTLTLADGVEFTGVTANGELVLSGDNAASSGWDLALMILFSFTMVAALIAFIVSLVIFACKFPRRRILSRENVVSMRWIAASLGALGLGTYGMMINEYLWLRHIALEGYRMTLSSPPSAIIVALVLVVLTEILNLAGKLQNEQDLTI